MDRMPDLDNILERLERYRQPATYGAVAGVVGGIAQGVMQGRVRTPRHSWVVSKRERQPTGYQAHEVHPDLGAALQSGQLITTAGELKQWLVDHP